ncbi:lysozyme [Bradyrhizobium sp. 139]|uniref:lysozyme n=1 Tax=Bradyrhizobium sp. 139 TaxID=2782616 RepID=UPI001FFAA0BE
MKNSRKTAVTLASAAALTCACTTVKPLEGLWLVAKVDKVGTGRPVTACYGETENVHLGQRFTKDECDALIERKLKRYDAEIGTCIHVELPDATRAAVLLFTYNVGSAGACRSTAIRKLNAGDIRGGCEALMQWTMAQGRVVPGLVNRRKKERALCLAGLEQPQHAAPVPAAPKSFWQRLRGWIFK